MKDCKDQELNIGDEIVFPYNASTSCMELRFAKITGFKGDGYVEFQLLQGQPKYCRQERISSYKVWKYRGSE